MKLLRASAQDREQSRVIGTRLCQRICGVTDQWSKMRPIIQRRLLDLNVREAYLKIKGNRPRIMKTMFVRNPRVHHQLTEAISGLSFQIHAKKKEKAKEEIDKRIERYNLDGENIVQVSSVEADLLNR